MTEKKEFNYDASTEVIAGIVGWFTGIAMFSFWQPKAFFEWYTPLIAVVFGIICLVLFLLNLDSKRNYIENSINLAKHEEAKK